MEKDTCCRMAVYKGKEKFIKEIESNLIGDRITSQSYMADVQHRKKEIVPDHSYNKWSCGILMSVVMTLLLLMSMSSECAGTTVILNMTVDYTCTSNEAIAYQWFLNSTNVSFFNISHDIGQVGPVSVLVLEFVPLNLNNTVVECNATLKDNRMETILQERLLVQGFLGPVSNFTFSVEDEILQLYWNAPSSILNDITYCLDLHSNFNEAVIFSQCGIEATNYTFPNFSLLNLICGNFSVSVLALNILGNGTPSTARIWNKELKVTNMDVFALNNKEKKLIYITMEQDICFSYTSLIIDGNEETILPGNRSNTFQFELQDDQIYHGKLIFRNRDLMSQRELNISAFDVSSTTVKFIEGQGALLSSVFVGNSEAEGVLYVFIYIEQENIVDFTRSLYYPVTKEQASVGVQRNVSAGHYLILSYDIDEDFRFPRETFPAVIEYKFQLGESDFEESDLESFCDVNISDTVVYINCSCKESIIYHALLLDSNGTVEGVGKIMTNEANCSQSLLFNLRREYYYFLIVTDGVVYYSKVFNTSEEHISTSSELYNSYSTVVTSSSASRTKADTKVVIVVIFGWINVVLIFMVFSNSWILWEYQLLVNENELIVTTYDDTRQSHNNSNNREPPGDDFNEVHCYHSDETRQSHNNSNNREPPGDDFNKLNLMEHFHLATEVERELLINCSMIVKRANKNIYIEHDTTLKSDQEKEIEEASRKVIEEQISILIQISGLNILGLPRSGNSTTIKRLIGEILNIIQAKFSKEQPSIGVAERNQVIIKSISKCIGFTSQCGKWTAKDLLGESGVLNQLIKEVAKQKEIEGACRRVVEEQISILIQIARLNFLGLPWSGKSTTIKRLIGEILNIIQAKFSKEQPSIGVAERNQVIIKSISKCIGFTSQRSKWTAKNLLGESGVLNQLIKEVAKLGSSAQENLQKPAQVVMEAAQPLIDKVETPSTTPREDKPPLQQPQQETSPHLAIGVSFDAEDVLASFQEAVSSQDFDTMKYLLEDTNYLINTDTGGQTKFLDLMSRFLMGPALNLIISRLVDSLDQVYKIYCTNEEGIRSPEEDSVVTVEDVIFQALASIACLKESYPSDKSSDTKGKDSSIQLQACSSKAMFVGTFRDKVTQEEYEKKDKILQQKIEQTDFYHENLVVYSSKDHLMFTLDDLKGSLEKIEAFRSILEENIRKYFKKIESPLSWSILSVSIHHQRKRTMTLRECRGIASKLSITPADLSKALWFLHYRIGVILYYPEVPGFSELIICDVQVVFDAATKLGKKTFTFENVWKKAAEMFKEKAQFTMADLQVATKGSVTDLILLEKLVVLLKHHKILAPLPQHDGDNGEVIYFMPCILKSAIPAELLDICSSSEVASLMFQYECGYMPLGVFSSLIIQLVSHNKDWKLIPDSPRRSKVEFHVGKKYDTVTLVSCLTFMEVALFRRPSATRLASSVCADVHGTLTTALKRVHADLKFHCAAKFQYVFECPTHPRKEHLSLLSKEDEDILLCMENLKRMDAMDMTDLKPQVWFKEIDKTSLTKHFTEEPSLWDTQILEMNYFYSIRYYDLSTCKNTELRIINEICANWEAIGGILGFKAADIEVIRNTGSGKTPQQCLCEVSTRWIQNASQMPRSQCYPSNRRGVYNLLEASEHSTIVNHLKAAITTTQSDLYDNFDKGICERCMDNMDYLENNSTILIGCAGVGKLHLADMLVKQDHSFLHNCILYALLAPLALKVHTTDCFHKLLIDEMCTEVQRKSSDFMGLPAYDQSKCQISSLVISTSSQMCVHFDETMRFTCITSSCNDSLHNNFPGKILVFGAVVANLSQDLVDYSTRYFCREEIKSIKEGIKGNLSREQILFRFQRVSLSLFEQGIGIMIICNHRYVKDISNEMRIQKKEQIKNAIVQLIDADVYPDETDFRLIFSVNSLIEEKYGDSFGQRIVGETIYEKQALLINISIKHHNLELTQTKLPESRIVHDPIKYALHHTGCHFQNGDVVKEQLHFLDQLFLVFCYNKFPDLAYGEPQFFDFMAKVIEDHSKLSSPTFVASTSISFKKFTKPAFINKDVLIGVSYTLNEALTPLNLIEVKEIMWKREYKAGDGEYLMPSLLTALDTSLQSKLTWLSSVCALENHKNVFTRCKDFVDSIQDHHHDFENAMEIVVSFIESGRLQAESSSTRKSSVTSLLIPHQMCFLKKIEITEDIFVTMAYQNWGKSYGIKFSEFSEWKRSILLPNKVLLFVLSIDETLIKKYEHIAGGSNKYEDKFNLTNELIALKEAINGNDSKNHMNSFITELNKIKGTFMKNWFTKKNCHYDLNAMVAVVWCCIGNGLLQAELPGTGKSLVIALLIPRQSCFPKQVENPHQLCFLKQVDNPYQSCFLKQVENPHQSCFLQQVENPHKLVENPRQSCLLKQVDNPCQSCLLKQVQKLEDVFVTIAYQNCGKLFGGNFSKFSGKLSMWLSNKVSLLATSFVNENSVKNYELISGIIICGHKSHNLRNKLMIPITESINGDNSTCSMNYFIKELKGTFMKSYLYPKKNCHYKRNIHVDKESQILRATTNDPNNFLRLKLFDQSISTIILSLIDNKHIENCDNINQSMKNLVEIVLRCHHLVTIFEETYCIEISTDVECFTKGKEYAKIHEIITNDIFSNISNVSTKMVAVRCRIEAIVDSLIACEKFGHQVVLMILSHDYLSKPCVLMETNDDGSKKVTQGAVVPPEIGLLAVSTGSKNTYCTWFKTLLSCHNLLCSNCLREFNNIQNVMISITCEEKSISSKKLFKEFFSELFINTSLTLILNSNLLCNISISFTEDVIAQFLEIFDQRETDFFLCERNLSTSKTCYWGKSYKWEHFSQLKSRKSLNFTSISIDPDIVKHLITVLYKSSSASVFEGDRFTSTNVFLKYFFEVNSKNVTNQMDRNAHCIIDFCLKVVKLFTEIYDPHICTCIEENKSTNIMKLFGQFFSDNTNNFSSQALDSKFVSINEDFYLCLYELMNDGKYITHEKDEYSLICELMKPHNLNIFRVIKEIAKATLIVPDVGVMKKNTANEISKHFVNIQCSIGEGKIPIFVLLVKDPRNICETRKSKEICNFNIKLGNLNLMYLLLSLLELSEVHEHKYCRDKGSFNIVDYFFEQICQHLIASKGAEMVYTNKAMDVSDNFAVHTKILHAQEKDIFIYEGLLKPGVNDENLIEKCIIEMDRQWIALEYARECPKYLHIALISLPQYTPYLSLLHLFNATEYETCLPCNGKFDNSAKELIILCNLKSIVPMKTEDILKIYQDVKYVMKELQNTKRSVMRYFVYPDMQKNDIVVTQKILSVRNANEHLKWKFVNLIGLSLSLILSEIVYPQLNEGCAEDSVFGNSADVILEDLDDPLSISERNQQNKSKKMITEVSNSEIPVELKCAKQGIEIYSIALILSNLSEAIMTQRSKLEGMEKLLVSYVWFTGGFLMPYMFITLSSFLFVNMIGVVSSIWSPSGPYYFYQNKNLVATKNVEKFLPLLKIEDEYHCVCKTRILQALCSFCLEDTSYMYGDLTSHMGRKESSIQDLLSNIS